MSKMAIGGVAVGTVLLAQTFVASVFSDAMLTITAAAVGFGVGWFVKK
jgi:hypothetical protein